MPRTITPIGFLDSMLPTLVKVPPDGDEWLQEVKYDGYRTQLAINGTTGGSRKGWASPSRPPE